MPSSLIAIALMKVSLSKPARRRHQRDLSECLPPHAALIVCRLHRSVCLQQIAHRTPNGCNTAGPRSGNSKRIARQAPNGTGPALRG
jgi:hypothetical protein